MPPAIIIFNEFSSGFIWSINETWLSIFVVLYVFLCVFAIDKEAVCERNLKHEGGRLSLRADLSAMNLQFETVFISVVCFSISILHF